MAISQAMCTSFKVELLGGVHNFAGTGADSFKIALYTSAASLGAATAAYSATNEVSGTGYTAGGADLTLVDPSADGTEAILDFADVSWGPGADFTARGALIYNATNGNKAVAVLDFGSDKAVSGGTFTIQMPAAAAGTAILRIA